MISRVSAYAAAFALVATTAIAFAAEAQQPHGSSVAQARTMRIVELPRVVVIGHRI